MLKLLNISLIAIGFVALGYAVTLISGLVKKLRPGGKHGVWSLLRVFTILFMAAFVLGGYVVYTGNEVATNLVLSSVFFCGSFFVITIVVSVTRQTKELEASRESDSEKETLLKEIHHRVKNNLQIIISLLRLEKSKLADRRAIESLTNCENKVYTMAALHERLYKHSELSKVNFSSYAEEIIDNVTHALGLNKSITRELNLCDAHLSLDMLIPLGLIMNEVLSNSIKHGFAGSREGTIYMHLIETEKDQFKLTMYDSGSGVPANFFNGKYHGLGAELIQDLVSQINGEVSIIPFSETRAFVIDFSI